MRARIRAAAALLALSATFGFPAASWGASASIAPSQLAAGKTVDVTVTAAQCGAYDVILSGAILVGPANLIDSGRKLALAPTHQFEGQVEVAAGAADGSHSLSVRCGGGNYGSVQVTVSHGQTKSQPGPGSANLVLTLGRTYAQPQGAADGDAVGAPIHISAASCHSSIATTVVFPQHAGIYNADGDGYGAGAEFHKGGTTFSDSHGVYVSPVLKPGAVSENLTCENRFGTVLSHFALHLKLVRAILTHYRSKLSPAGVFQSLMPGFNGINSGGLGSDVFVSVPACRDPAALLTLTSPGLVPQTITSPNHHIGVTDFEGWETTFAFDTVTAVSAPGDYPETISCGGGKVAEGTLRIG